MRNGTFLLCLLVASVSQAGSPELRHLNYLAIEPKRGEVLEIDVHSIAHGIRSAQDRQKWRVVEQSGYVVAEGATEVGKDASLRVPVSWDGKCAIEMNSGSNLTQLTFQSDTPHAYLSRLTGPLTTVRAWGPLYFFVPKDTRYFNIWIQASAIREGLHYTIRDPEGEVVKEDDGEFDERTKVQILLPKSAGFDGRAWSIEISSPTSPGMHLDDVNVELGRHLPPFLAPKPEWAAMFARGWTAEAATSSKSKITATTPKVKPFHGIDSPEVDAAYDRDVTQGWHTTLPVTYVLDYGSRHVSNPQRIPAVEDPNGKTRLLGDPKYVERVGTAPPTLLHLGKDTALNHAWGPVKSLGGENVAYGRGDYVTRLTPQELGDRVTTLRELAAGLREVGVRWVTPYICAMTINGNHEQRTGFWDFYDHWDDYRGQDLGPRPSGDPFTWLQRKPDGTPRFYYGYTGDHYPSFDSPNHRYAASWHIEGYREWMREVVRFVAKCDFDGCFVDNGTSQRGIGPEALAEFKKYLHDKFGPEQARTQLGVEDIDTVKFPTKPETPLFAEMNRFWCETIADQMAFIKRVGSEELGRDFIVYPNGGRPAFIQRALMDTDFAMFEKSQGEYGTHPGLVFAPVFDNVKLRAYNDNIYEHKFVQSLRKRVKPMILSRPGYPARLPWATLNTNAAELGLAEAAAFSGGGGFLLRPSFDVYHDALNTYRRFFETHPQLYAGLDTYAPVGVLVWPEQDWYGNHKHTGAVRRLTNALGEAHLLFDYIPESQTTSEMLSRYDSVVAPNLEYVSDEQLAALGDYVKAGGRLLTIGEFATHDAAMKERAAENSLNHDELVRCQNDKDALAAIAGDQPDAVADSPELQHVKLNAFRSDQRIVVHVVNYNVPLGDEALPITEIDEFELMIPLPPGAECSKAICYTPGQPQPVELTVRCEAGKAIAKLPKLRIYHVVELTVNP